MPYDGRGTKNVCWLTVLRTVIERLITVSQPPALRLRLDLQRQNGRGGDVR